MNFENDFSSDSTDRSESLTTTDNESESAEQLDPWIPLIEEAKQRSNIAFEETKESLLNSGLDEGSATKLAYSNILPKLQKELESVYTQRLMWMVQFRNDPVHRKIMQTKDACMKNKVRVRVRVKVDYFFNSHRFEVNFIHIDLSK